MLSHGLENPHTAWWPLGLIGSTYHMLGEHERELEYVELGLARFPSVGHLLGGKAGPLAAMGRIEEVNQVIDESLRSRVRSGVGPGQMMTGIACELGFHGFREESDAMAARAIEWFEAHRSELAARPRDHLRLPVALMLTGRPEEARDVLLELAEDVQYVWPDPLSSPTAIQGSLGIVAARLGDREEALRISDTISPGDDPRSVVGRFYWRAAIAAHLGEKDRAVELLTDAFSAGLPYAVDWHSAFAFEPLWDYPPYLKPLEPKG